MKIWIWAAIAIVAGVFFAADCDLDLLLLPYSKYVNFSGSSSDAVTNTMFDNQVVWITGASSGIGAGLAEELTRSGAQVILSARRVDKLQEVAERCAKYGKGAPFILPLDVTDLKAQEAAFDTIIEKFGRVDSVVLNAGKSQRNMAETTPFESTKEIFDLNFFSYIHLVKVVLPSMIERHQGQLVVMSSLSGHIPTPIASSYSASKFALHGYFNTLRSEIQDRHNISVTLICPGPVESEIALHTIRDPNLPAQEEGSKMATSRCAYLTAKAMHYRLPEVWISGQPFLAMTYLQDYLPSVSRWFLTHVVGPSRIRTQNEGGNIYDITAIFGMKSTSPSTSPTPSPSSSS